MITIRPSAERGQTRISWLDSRHSFSFNRYYDPHHENFRALRVINEDWIAPGGKFGKHPHRDMEIVTWVLAGALEHEDSTGSSGLIRPGDAQKMSAGTGIFHSEANASATETCHMLQIWIEPREHGLEPYYAQAAFPPETRSNQLRLIASDGGRDESLPLHQDVDLYAALLDPGTSVELPLRPGRAAWLQVARGSVNLNGVTLKAGDGASAEAEPLLRLDAIDPTEVLVFDLA